jgi:hypothetical protein
MSRKSRHHGQHMPRSKRRKFRQGFVPAQPSAVAPQPSAAAQTYEPTPRAERIVPVAKAPTPQPAITLAQPPYVAAELRRIGILFGIILVILVVLTLVLH